MAPKILTERGPNPLSLIAIFHPLLKIKRKKKPLTQLYSANPNTPAGIINLSEQRKLTRRAPAYLTPRGPGEEPALSNTPSRQPGKPALHTGLSPVAFFLKSHQESPGYLVFQLMEKHLQQRTILL